MNKFTKTKIFISEVLHTSGVIISMPLEAHICMFLLLLKLSKKKSKSPIQ